MNKLSKYAETNFINFLKNKTIQETINNIVIFKNIASIDEIVDICLTMFLSTIEINKLNGTDLELLKNEIKKVRSVELNYDLTKFIETTYKKLPNPTDKFIIDEVLKRTKVNI